MVRFLGRVKDKEASFSTAHPIYESGLRENSSDGEKSGIMTYPATRAVGLKWDVFVAPGIPVVASDLPADAKQRLWSPVSSILICGTRDAVLVDALLTVQQAEALVDYIRDFGRIAETAQTAVELSEQMLALHTHRVNPGMLRASARAIKGWQCKTPT
jgi:hypothetical protein